MTQPPLPTFPGLVAAVLSLAAMDHVLPANAQPAGKSDSFLASRSPVTITIDFYVKADQTRPFLDSLSALLDDMSHEGSFINAVLHRNPDDETHFMLYETWADLDELKNVQAQRDYRHAFMSQLPNFLREPRRIQIWRPIRSDFTNPAKASP